MKNKEKRVKVHLSYAAIFTRRYNYYPESSGEIC